ncbi:hypothetical protein BCR33DRAFT_714044 [Rhizoclosmatium globosum]|uniref:Uncharacterized protein n=1 Tax=Rhizoclosmatium globosum TaxID=329046 RepID=A0A1Y2CPJ0_9FUNG|nr:hypothetical protein BCR33DRAFT_714044 [Rhizoclosmatium globosum]|eukprot:ORY48941.1 hypothetical protein BCR33DRAFT_714044 [Rhizoclosmatium globosum]
MSVPALVQRVPSKANSLTFFLLRRDATATVTSNQPVPPFSVLSIGIAFMNITLYLTQVSRNRGSETTATTTLVYPHLITVNPESGDIEISNFNGGDLTLSASRRSTAVWSVQLFGLFGLMAEAHTEVFEFVSSKTARRRKVQD